MTAPPARRLRAVCPGPEENPGPVSSLRLISALAAHGRVASATGLGPSGAEHELRLPGIGGRYLAGIAAHATDRGWAPDEVCALLHAVEHRTAMWIVAPSASALTRAGLGRCHRGLRAPCARWSAGTWSRARVDGRSLAAIASAGGARGVCAGAVSGRGAPERIVRALRVPGVRMGELDRGLAAALGVRWTVELLVAPALRADSLMALRERVASAPRCGWCGVPMLGPVCRRCSP